MIFVHLQLMKVIFCRFLFNEISSLMKFNITLILRAKCEIKLLPRVTSSPFSFHFALKSIFLKIHFSCRVGGSYLVIENLFFNWNVQKLKPCCTNLVYSDDTTSIDFGVSFALVILVNMTIFVSVTNSQLLFLWHRSMHITSDWVILQFQIMIPASQATDLQCLTENKLNLVKFAYGGLVSGWGQFSLLLQPPQKIMLATVVVKGDSK